MALCAHLDSSAFNLTIFFHSFEKLGDFLNTWDILRNRLKSSQGCSLSPGKAQLTDSMAAIQTFLLNMELHCNRVTFPLTFPSPCMQQTKHTSNNTCLQNIQLLGAWRDTLINLTYIWVAVFTYGTGFLVFWLVLFWFFDISIAELS